MNRKLANLWKQIVGFVLFGAVIRFILDLNDLREAFENVDLSHILLVTVIILISGCGIQLSRVLCCCDRMSCAIKIAIVLWTIAYLMVQFLINVSPDWSSCQCTTFFDSLSAVSNWNRTLYAVGLLGVSLLFVKTYKYAEKTEER